MRIAKLTALLATTLTLPACSIHPLQDDVTRMALYDVIHQIRCEAHQAINEVDTKRRLDPVRLVMTFRLTALEANGAGLSGGLTVPIHNGTFGLEAGANKSLSREAQREVILTQTLVKLREREDCGTELARKNLKYPISGQIGLFEVFQRYEKLSEGQDGKALKGYIDYRDTLTFMTKLDGDITPRITISPVPKVFSFGGSLSAERTDTHYVELSFQPPNPETTWEDDIQPVQLVFGELEGTKGEKAPWLAAQARDRGVEAQLSKLIDELKQPVKEPEKITPSNAARKGLPEVKTDTEADIANKAAEEATAIERARTREHLESALYELRQRKAQARSTVPQVDRGERRSGRGSRDQREAIRAMRDAADRERLDYQRDIRDFLDRQPLN